MNYGESWTCPECNWVTIPLYKVDNKDYCVHCHHKKEKYEKVEKLSPCCSSKIVWDFNETIYVCKECRKEVKQ